MLAIVDAATAQGLQIAQSSADAAWAAVPANWAGAVANVAVVVLTVVVLLRETFQKRAEERELVKAGRKGIDQSIAALDRAHVAVRDVPGVLLDQQIADRRMAMVRARGVLKVLLRRHLRVEQISVIVAVTTQLDAGIECIETISRNPTEAARYIDRLKELWRVAMEAARDLPAK